MTVQTNTNVASFNGNGVTQIFPIAFKFNNDTDLVALLVDDATGSASLLTLNSDYTVSGEGDEEGGLINVVVAPAAGTRLKVTRVVDILQLTDLRNQGKFFAEVHEDAFDLLTMIAQQHESGINSSLRVAESDPEPARIPAVAQRANKILSFDAEGNPQVVAPVTDSSTGLRLDLADSTGASLVGFTAGGTGATTRALEKKIVEIVSVKDYGAVGDGVADDTAAIQAAIAYVASLGGGIVQVPSGTYGINAAGNYTGIQLKTGVYLSMYGAKLKAISSNQPSYRLINIEQVSNCGVFGGEIQGDRATNTATGEWGHCLHIILDCTNITIKDVRVSDGFGDGIYIGRQCSDVHVLNCTVTNNRRNNISVVTASNVVIDGCDISNANGTLPECGIDIEPNTNDLPSSNVVITNCNIFGNNKDGIGYSAPPPTPLIESSVISNCHIYNNGRHGILASYIKVLEVTNCVIRNNGGDGISDSAALATLLNFNGNAIYDNTGSGLFGFSSNTIITNNQIKGSGQWGVHWQNGNHVTISGNLISDSGQDGIYYERAYNSSIVGNTVKNSQKHGILITGTSTSSATHSRKVTISGNNVAFSGLLADNTYSGIYLDTYANTCTITGNTIAAGTAGNLPQYAIYAADATVNVSGNQTDGAVKSGNAQVSVGGVALPSFINSPSMFGYTYASRMYVPGQAFVTGGTGSPEGVVTAGAGSIYLRADGGAGTSFYVKQTAAGNTGWAAK